MRRLSILSTALLLSSCGIVHTLTRFPDGTISETYASSVGSTAAVDKFKDDVKASNKTGRVISFTNGAADVNVEALQQTNELLGTLVGSAVKAAIK